jgi:hypothetical protein
LCLNHHSFIFFVISFQLLFTFVSSQINTGALFLFDFFRYSNLAISSFFHRQFKKSFKAQGLWGNETKKYLFNHSYFILLSFTSISLSKSKFHHDIITTIVFHFIFSFKSFNASVANAQAGSTTIQSSFKYSSIVEHTLFSGHLIISKSYFLAILNVFSHTLLTAAQSTNISIVSKLVFFHSSRDFLIAEAHFGSAQIILVFFDNSQVDFISQDTTHHHQIGQTI